MNGSLKYDLCNSVKHLDYFRSDNHGFILDSLANIGPELIGHDALLVIVY